MQLSIMQSCIKLQKEILTSALPALEALVLPEAFRACRLDLVQEDLVLTRCLYDAGETMGIPMRDHLILGSCKKFMSLGRRKGW